MPSDPLDKTACLRQNPIYYFSCFCCIQPYTATLAPRSARSRKNILNSAVILETHISEVVSYISLKQSTLLQICKQSQSPADTYKERQT